MNKKSLINTEWAANIYYGKENNILPDHNQGFHSVNLWGMYNLTYSLFNSFTIHGINMLRCLFPNERMLRISEIIYITTSSTLCSKSMSDSGNLAPLPSGIPVISSSRTASLSSCLLGHWYRKSLWNPTTPSSPALADSRVSILHYLPLKRQCCILLHRHVDIILTKVKLISSSLY